MHPLPDHWPPSTPIHPYLFPLQLTLKDWDADSQSNLDNLTWEFTHMYKLDHLPD